MTRRTKEESGDIVATITAADRSISSASLARSLGVSREYVRQVRSSHGIGRYNYMETFTEEQLGDIAHMLRSSKYSFKDVADKYGLTSLQVLRLRRRLVRGRTARCRFYRSKYDSVIRKFARGEFQDKDRDEIMREEGLSLTDFRNVIKRLSYRGISYRYRKKRPGRQAAKK